MAQPSHLETVTVTPPNASPAQWALTDLMFPHARLLHQFCTRGTRFIAVTAVANCNTHAAMTTKQHTAHIYIDVGLITVTDIRHCNTNAAMTTKQYIAYIYIYIYIPACLITVTANWDNNEALQHNMSFLDKVTHFLPITTFKWFCSLNTLLSQLRFGGGGGGGNWSCFPLHKVETIWHSLWVSKILKTEKKKMAVTPRWLNRFIPVLGDHFKDFRNL